MSVDHRIKIEVNPIKDSDYKKHLKVLQVCREAEVSLPQETAYYFGCMTDDYYGAEINFIQRDIPFTIEQPSEGLRQYVINVSDIPAGANKIMFQFLS